MRQRASHDRQRRGPGGGRRPADEGDVGGAAQCRDAERRSRARAAAGGRPGTPTRRSGRRGIRRSTADAPGPTGRSGPAARGRCRRGGPASARRPASRARRRARGWRRRARCGAGRQCRRALRRPALVTTSVPAARPAVPRRGIQEASTRLGNPPAMARPAGHRASTSPEHPAPTGVDLNPSAFPGTGSARRTVSRSRPGQGGRRSGRAPRPRPARRSRGPAWRRPRGAAASGLPPREPAAEHRERATGAPKRRRPVARPAPYAEREEHRRPRRHRGRPAVRPGGRRVSRRSAARARSAAGRPSWRRRWPRGFDPSPG